MATREEIASIFPQLVERLKSAQVQAINAAIQFDLSGDNGGMYWLNISDDNVESGEGAVDSPKMTVRSSGDDFKSMITGELNPMQAFMMGKIKINGDTNLALKLMPLFNAG